MIWWIEGMEKMRYLAVIHKDPGSYYGVTIPDLPGCFSAGDTFEDAAAQAQEAAQLQFDCHVIQSGIIGQCGEGTPPTVR